MSNLTNALGGDYGKWWIQKASSLFISVSIYGLAIISVFVARKIITPEVFRDLFIAIVVTRAGKDVFDRVSNNKNNKNANSNQEEKI